MVGKADFSGIGKLEPVPLRELWKHERHGFSVWLENHLELLAESLDLDLSAVQREKSVGPFSVDLVAEDHAGNLVIIENQLETTDHDHLGKLLTYATNLDAKTSIWITAEPRPEHVQAMIWLNETTPVDVFFYLVSLTAYRIGDSAPAPLFKVVAGPSPETKAIGRDKKDLAERHLKRMKFWEQLLERARERGVHHHSNVSPSKESWLSTGAGRTGLVWVYLIWMDGRAGVELYIDTGDGDRNSEILEHLRSHSEKVEEEFGDSLDWQALEGRRACRVRYAIEEGGLDSPENEWAGIQDQMIETMDRLVSSLGPHIP